jgi:hypothetical protein
VGATNRHDQLPHCHDAAVFQDISECYSLDQRTGRRREPVDRKIREYTTATTMYLDMGMTYWLEKAEAEMRELE